MPSRTKGVTGGSGSVNPDPEIAAKEVCDNWKSSSARNSDGGGVTLTPPPVIRVLRICLLLSLARHLVVLNLACQPSLPMKQRNPREGVRPLSRGRRNGPGGRGMQPTRAGWYRGIFYESPNRREPVKRYSQRVIINTHLWEPGEALTMRLSADSYLLTGASSTPLQAPKDEC